MVDINKLRSRMALKGFTQRALVAEMNKKGQKITENTLSSKMNGKSQFDCEDATAICEILNLNCPAEKAEIFLA